MSDLYWQSDAAFNMKHFDVCSVLPDLHGYVRKEIIIYLSVLWQKFGSDSTEEDNKRQIAVKRDISITWPEIDMNVFWCIYFLKSDSSPQN